MFCLSGICVVSFFQLCFSFAVSFHFSYLFVLHIFFLTWRFLCLSLSNLHLIPLLVLLLVLCFIFIFVFSNILLIISSEPLHMRSPKKTERPMPKSTSAVLAILCKFAEIPFIQIQSLAISDKLKRCSPRGAEFRVFMIHFTGVSQILSFRMHYICKIAFSMYFAGLFISVLVVQSGCFL